VTPEPTTAIAFGPVPSRRLRRSLGINNIPPKRCSRWSGDHCGTAREVSAGVLFTNRRLARDDPHILDIAPTILTLLEVPLPADLDGRPFL
jgi:hypothetical protein